MEYFDRRDIQIITTQESLVKAFNGVTVVIGESIRQRGEIFNDHVA